MRFCLVLAVAVMACGGKSKPRDTTANSDQCFYGCEGSAQATPSSTGTPAAAPQKPRGALTPAGERAALLRQAADLLEKAGDALAGGNKNLAEQLFPPAELLTGPRAVATLASQFREGAPPRVTTPTIAVDKNAPPQPKTSGSSEAEDDADKVPPPKIETGSLTGTVQIQGKAGGGAYSLVTLEPASGRWKPRTPKRHIVEQRGREFNPHIVAISVGSTVQFPNFDTVFHNVFSTSPQAAFDLGIYKAGEAREYRFDKEGIIRLGCNLHANMSAYIVVVSQPAYVVTDDAGAFKFNRLAPGKYKLKAWSERSKAPITQDVTIKAGANNISVGVAADAPAGPLPDKFGGKRG